MPSEQTEPPIAPFRLIVSVKAQRRVGEIRAWLQSMPFGGEEAAVRFQETVGRELRELCADLTQRFATGSNLPRPDEEASLAFSRPAYRHTFTTAASGKRRKRQTSGVYFVLYDLTSGENTVNVITIRHGASEPLTAFLDEPRDAGGNSGEAGE